MPELTPLPLLARSFVGFLSLVVLLVYYLFFSSSSPHMLADPHPGDTAIAVLFVVRLSFLSSTRPRLLGQSCRAPGSVVGWSARLTLTTHALPQISAMHCLLCSTTWHLFAGCATIHWHRGAACVDYVGISGLIAASVAGSTCVPFSNSPSSSTPTS